LTGDEDEGADRREVSLILSSLAILWNNRGEREEEKERAKVSVCALADKL
jgi:hypothetical protein